MEKYTMYMDTVIIRLKHEFIYESCSYFYNVSYYLSKFFREIEISEVPRNRLAKLDRSYIKSNTTTYTTSSGYEKCIKAFSFIGVSDATIPNSYFLLYARSGGVYCEVHGITQYHESYRQEKFRLLHLLYSEYSDSFVFSRLDIAIDIRVPLSTVSILDKKHQALPLDVASTKTISYFVEGKGKRVNQTRSLKIYDKGSQKLCRHVPYSLTRVELTLKGQKLKDIGNVDALVKRLHKELLHYHIFVDTEEVHISTNDIEELCEDTYSLLKRGKNRQTYSNRYKTLDDSLSKAQLAYQCYLDHSNVKVFASKNNISEKTLYKNIKFYKRRSNE